MDALTQTFEVCPLIQRTGLCIWMWRIATAKLHSFLRRQRQQEWRCAQAAALRAAPWASDTKLPEYQKIPFCGNRGRRTRGSLAARQGKY